MCCIVKLPNSICCGNYQYALDKTETIKKYFPQLKYGLVPLIDTEKEDVIKSAIKEDYHFHLETNSYSNVDELILIFEDYRLLVFNSYEGLTISHFEIIDKAKLDDFIFYEIVLKKKED